LCIIITTTTTTITAHHDHDTDRDRDHASSSFSIRSDHPFIPYFAFLDSALDHPSNPSFLPPKHPINCNSANPRLVYLAIIAPVTCRSLCAPMRCLPDWLGRLYPGRSFLCGLPVSPFSVSFLASRFLLHSLLLTYDSATGALTSISGRVSNRHRPRQGRVRYT
jgi:hypothetical protein